MTHETQTRPFKIYMENKEILIAKTDNEKISHTIIEQVIMDWNRIKETQESRYPQYPKPLKCGENNCISR